MDLVRLTWEWVGFEAYVKCFNSKGVSSCGNGWKVGWEVSSGKVLAGAGERKRWECGRTDRLSLGSSRVEMAHNLLNEGDLSEWEAEERTDLR